MIVAVPEPTTTAVVTESANTMEGASYMGLGILQKVLFLTVIVGCVLAYLRMSRKTAKEYNPRSMA